MDDDDVGKLFGSLLPMLLEAGDEAERLVLSPMRVDGHTVAFGVRFRGQRHIGGFGADRHIKALTWAGAQVSGVNAQESTRLRYAREYWSFHEEEGKFYARAGLYALVLREGDNLSCQWDEKRTDWTWRRGSLYERSADAFRPTYGRTFDAFNDPGEDETNVE